MLDEKDKCTCRPKWTDPKCPQHGRPKRYGSNDALSSRMGPAEWDYMNRFNSPDNERDSMG